MSFAPNIHVIFTRVFTWNTRDILVLNMSRVSRCFLNYYCDLTEIQLNNINFIYKKRKILKHTTADQNNKTIQKCYDFVEGVLIFNQHISDNPLLH